MDEMDIAALKRRAKLASRESGRSHQQELDTVAREEGHAHWGDLIRNAQIPTPQNRAGGRAVAAHVATTDDWASRLLDVATGARTTPLDEATIRWLGKPICSLVGHGAMPTAIASATLSLTAGWIVMRCGMHPEYDAIDAIFMPVVLIVSLLFHRVAWLNPDSAVLRQLRRSIRNAAAAITIVIIASIAPGATEAAAYMQRSQLLSPIGNVCFWLVPMIPLLVGTYAGRRTGRRE